MTSSLDLGDGFLVGIWSALSSAQTGFVAILIALIAAIAAAIAIHFWSWLWNTQWNGLALVLSQLLVFVCTFVAIFLIIGISHAEDYISATALKLRTTLKDSAGWRQSAMLEAYNQIQKNSARRPLVNPTTGDNHLELQTNEDVKTYFAAVSKAASEAVAESSVIPTDVEASAAQTGAYPKPPLRITPNNDWADRALASAIHSWTASAREWCATQLGGLRTVVALAAVAVILLAMAISAAGAWHDISA